MALPSSADRGTSRGTTTSVDTYPGRIFKQGKVVHMSNHILSIVGWGYDADLDKEYWVLRNSW